MLKFEFGVFLRQLSQKMQVDQVVSQVPLHEGFDTAPVAL
jgi:hypothetical protein